MTRTFLALCFSLLCTFASAAEVKLSGPDISKLLTEKSLYAEGVEQIFRASGQTFYLQNGSSSAGSWKVQGDQYCSVWPPNPSWACYDVMEDGGTVTFIAKDGKRFPMKLKP